ncbi:class I SAM-dependent methyltransferase [Roseimaritima ulvae]|uniref:Bifunctional 3-demethylubiquinone-9 3-methyltransferase/ 2-octaprenyl-6-hydroxy phenol methylase n=1 Tax=Roseimaritima ulvae TaxID=980254 RepID=A0A5B9QXG9_9BACT|nr:hypothetical protein [Roseimaritima ulvae]QEG38661.1 hypothetical protein UC8_06190 [Roseimaritima ulvae]
MKLHASCLPFLDSREFSASYQVKFDFVDSDWTYRSRLDVLSEMAVNKNIIHVGCVDHSIQKVNTKRKHKQWLHEILCGVSARCVGVDILEDCITYIRDDLGYDDMFAGNILEDNLPFLNGVQWDVFLPEIIEHVDNPVDFLTRLRQRLKGHMARAVISVPNAFAKIYSDAADQSYELINSDHRYSFTPYTLAKIAHLSGYEVGEIQTCGYGRLSRRRVVRNFLMKRRPLRRDDIVMVVYPRS